MFYVSTEENQPTPTSPATAAKRSTGAMAALEALRASPTAAIGGNKSATLKSTAESEYFNTPPESPQPPSSPRLPHSQRPMPFVVDNNKPPIPPPRAKRLAAAGGKKLERLKLSESLGGLGGSGFDRRGVGRSASQGDEPRRAGSPSAVAAAAAAAAVTDLRGHLSMRVISAKGLRQIMKVRYFVYDKKNGRLKYFRSEEEAAVGEGGGASTAALGEIDIQSATFCYDIQSDRNGEFTIW